MANAQARTATTVGQRAVAELRRIISKYSDAEAEVVRAYFSELHSTEEHIEVMLKQMGREIQVRNWIERVVPMARDLEQGVERHDFVKYLREQAEEVEHY